MYQTRFFANSWCKFPFDPALANWVQQVLPTAKRTRFEDANKHWLRCGETWFAGVNVLPNDSTGAIAEGVPLTGTMGFGRSSVSGRSRSPLPPASTSAVRMEIDATGRV